MTAAGRVREPALKSSPRAFTSDVVVREALARYLGAVAERLRRAGHWVSGPTLALPDEHLAATLTASPAPSKARAALVVASWNEETGWSTRRDQPDQPGSARRYLHLCLVPAPTLAAQFITAAVTSAAVPGLAIADYPLQFRYRTGRAEYLLTQLTRAA
ncbi:DUF6292 family protein [Pseudonocardia sp. Cha107L01]|jgi:hypothetical protein|uniref:DUF6292 family protein n=1 Tax=Pseudonocardia sp. Cha107L01 TaxID=3457576 RepID=UPI00403E87FF